MGGSVRNQLPVVPLSFCYSLSSFPTCMSWDPLLDVSPEAGVLPGAEMAFSPLQLTVHKSGWLGWNGRTLLRALPTAWLCLGSRSPVCTMITLTREATKQQGWRVPFSCCAPLWDQSCLKKCGSCFQMVLWVP